MSQDLIHAEFVLTGAKGRPFGLDVTATVDARQNVRPVLLFLHGFKGFKDWGHFPLIAQEAAKQGFIVVKYNLSHNGVTPEHPLDFVDLEAFGNNTHRFELQDTQITIDWIFNNMSDKSGRSFSSLGLKADLSRFYFIGHSRGGAIALLQTAKDERITALATWAGVGDLQDRFPANLRALIKTKGVFHLHNARTNQQMPIFEGIIKDLEENILAYDLLTAVEKLRVPYLVVHGDSDESVHLSEAKRLAGANQALTQLVIIAGGTHTFGGSHPYTQNELPPATVTLLEETLSFFRATKSNS